MARLMLSRDSRSSYIAAGRTGRGKVEGMTPPFNSQSLVVARSGDRK